MERDDTSGLELRKCTSCGQEKPATTEYFYKKSNGGLNAWCIECFKAKHKVTYNLNKEAYKARARKDHETNRERNKKRMNEWRAANIDKVLEKKKEYYKNNKEMVLEGVKRWRENNPDKVKSAKLKRAYGITLEEYNVLLEKHDNRCYACGRTDSLVVDHCHTTGVIRGILCNNCNSALGFVNDEIETLNRMIDYLERHK
jgi:recombinational DNA repair protein (RecF pathway)